MGATTLGALAVGHAIRDTRERQGLSARQLSLSAGLSESYVSKIESGEMSQPSFRAVSKIFTALKLKPGEIYMVVVAESQQ